MWPPTYHIGHRLHPLRRAEDVRRRFVGGSSDGVLQHQQFGLSAYARIPDVDQATEESLGRMDGRIGRQLVAASSLEEASL